MKFHHVNHSMTIQQILLFEQLLGPRWLALKTLNLFEVNWPKFKNFATIFELNLKALT